MLRNPYTRRPIQAGGATHRKLLQEGGVLFGKTKLDPNEARAMYMELFKIRKAWQEEIGGKVVGANLNKKYNDQLVEWYYKGQQGLDKIMTDLEKKADF